MLENRQMLAVDLVTYEMAGNSDGRETSEAASYNASGVSAASVLQRGAGLAIPTTGSQPNGIYALSSASNGAYPSSISAAATASSAWTFNLTPANGKTLAISSIDFTPYVQSGSVAGSFTLQYANASSGGWQTLGTVTTSAGMNSVVKESVSTTGVTNLQSVTGITGFRILVWGVSQYYENALGRYSGNDVVVSGTISDSVPVAAEDVEVHGEIGSLGNTVTWDHYTYRTGFQVERAVGSASGFSTIATVGSAVFTYTDTNVTPGERYYYRVKAVNGAATSAASASDNMLAFQLYDAWQGDPSYILKQPGDFGDTRVVTLDSHTYFNPATSNYGILTSTGLSYASADPTNLSSNWWNFDVATHVNVAALQDWAEDVNDNLDPGEVFLVVNDLEQFWVNHGWTEAMNEKAVEVQQDIAELIRDVAPDLKLGLYPAINDTFWFVDGWTQAGQDELNEWLVEELFVPGVYYDFSAQHVYNMYDYVSPTYSTQNMAHNYSVATNRNRVIDKLVYEGTTVIPYVGLTQLPGLTPLSSDNTVDHYDPWYNLTNIPSQIELIASNVRTAGNVAIIWQGGDHIWTQGIQDVFELLVLEIEDHV